jgi:hypothetical protein
MVINEISNQPKMKRWILFFVVALFIISLIPIFYIGVYNHPSVDDYSNSYFAHNTFQKTGSVVKTLKSAVIHTVDFYKNWQGTFSAVFLMTSSPIIWGDNLYFLSAIILVLSFIISNLFFSYELLIKLLKASRASWLIIISIIMGVSIQFVPSPVSAFFWYTGSIYYTFFYSLSLLLFGLIIKYILNNKQKDTLKYSFITLPIAVFIGGGNFVTSLISAIIIAFIMVYLIITKNKKSKLLIAIFVAIVIAILLTSLAPGNMIRQNVHDKSTPLIAVKKSFYYGLKYILMPEWQRVKAPWAGVCFIGLAIPFTYEIIRNPKNKFKYPLIALVLSFCIFSAQFTPALYSMSSSGPMRLRNIIYYSYLWLLLFNTTYLLGWIYKLFEKKNSGSESKLIDFHKRTSSIYKKSLLPLLSVLLIIAVILLSKSGQTITSVSAGTSLISGEAKQYDKEYDERVKHLKTDEKIVELSPLSVKPYVLFFDDISDPSDWKNECLALYYNKEKVILK